MLALTTVCPKRPAVEEGAGGRGGGATCFPVYFDCLSTCHCYSTYW